jgi:hypothetical protein
MAVSANRSNLLAVKLIELRRHLMICYACHGAIKSQAHELLCDMTKQTILDIAMKWDANIAGRIAARKDGGKLQFLCPDPNAHGAAYAATAEAVTVTSIQDGLW